MKDRIILGAIFLVLFAMMGGVIYANIHYPHVMYYAGAAVATLMLIGTIFLFTIIGAEKRRWRRDHAEAMAGAAHRNQGQQLGRCKDGDHDWKPWRDHDGIGVHRMCNACGKIEHQGGG